VELRPKTQQSYIDRQPSWIDQAEWASATGEISHLEIQIVPLLDSQQNLLGASIGCTDVTLSKRSSGSWSTSTSAFRSPSWLRRCARRSTATERGRWSR
jgi:hypothetical protein